MNHGNDIRTNVEPDVVFSPVFFPNFLAALQFTRGGGEDLLSHLYVLELPIGLQQLSVPAAVCQLMHFMG